MEKYMEILAVWKEGLEAVLTDWQKWLNPYLGVPVRYTEAAAAVCLLLAVVFGIRARRFGKGFWTGVLFFWMYTVFCGVFLGRGNGEIGRIRPKLFWCIRTALETGNWVYWYYIAGNILLFLPLGAAIEGLCRGKKRSWLRFFAGLLLCGAASFCFSAGIEMLQYRTGRGVCEIDDVFNNTLGGILGYFAAAWMENRIEKIKETIRRS